MFRNSLYAWKLGGAVALVAAMTAASARRGESIHPPAWKCLAEPERWHGEELRISGPVLSADKEGFVIRWQEVPLRVRGPSPAAPGEEAEVVGTFDQDGPHLRPREARRIPPRAKYRWIGEVISIAVLGLILLNFLRHFAFRPGAARLRGL